MATRLRAPGGEAPLGTLVGSAPEKEKRKEALGRVQVVYFEGEEEYAIMELAAGRHGKATAAATAPGQVQKWKGGWMVLVPTTEQDGLVPRPRVQAALGVDDAEMTA